MIHSNIKYLFSSARLSSYGTVYYGVSSTRLFKALDLYELLYCY